MSSSHMHAKASNMFVKMKKSTPVHLLLPCEPLASTRIDSSNLTSLMVAQRSASAIAVDNKLVASSGDDSPSAVGELPSSTRRRTASRANAAMRVRIVCHMVRACRKVKCRGAVLSAER